MDTSLVFSIAFFVLSIPAAVGANLLTPHLKNWWGKSSIKRAEKRLAELESKENQLDTFIASKQELIVFLLREILNLILIFTYPIIMLLIFLFMLATSAINELPPPVVRYLLLTIFSGFYIWAVIKMVNCFKVIKNVENPDSFRLKIEKSKQVLKKVISSKIGISTEIVKK